MDIDDVLRRGEISVMDFDDLKDYLSSKGRMRMSHVYKPLMLLKIIESGGRAERAEIAKEFILADVGQQREYERKVHPMPGTRLVSAGLIKKDGTAYALSEVFKGLSDEQMEEVKVILRNRVDDYLGLTNPYNSNGREYISGTIRYEVLKRAGGRCELCGVSVSERQLDVDHIIPVSKNGSNDESNYQALCRTCNAQKGNRDDTDFRMIKRLSEQRRDDCIFCQFQGGHERLVVHNGKRLENDVGYALYDGFAVTEGHTLFIPKRHVSDYFDLYASEVSALNRLIQKQKEFLQAADPSITGWNIGVNVNASGGQTVMHVHMHLIPRRDGDIEDPRGGVRGVIPNKQNYKK